MDLRIRARLWRLRWLVAALCVGLAAAIVVYQLRPPPPPSSTVVVAARDLPAGTVLSEQDLASEAMPPQYPGMSQTEHAVGERLAVGLPAGAALSPSMLLGAGLVAAAPPGTVVLPVRLADAALMQLARPGDRLDLYLASADAAGTGAEADRVAQDALFLSLLSEESQETSLLSPAPVGSDGNETVVVLAVRESDATLLTGASSVAAFRAVLVTDSTSS
ncbi:MAG TPA: SAF domain-containing protein [Beutenbergiaceae bacterium]|nr:SAF domain-containing protein [Beutenbergiaceae bacterium]